MLGYRLNPSATSAPQGAQGRGSRPRLHALIGPFEIGGSAGRRTAAAAVGNARTHAQIEPEAPRREK